jgi:hypothetical protein
VNHLYLLEVSRKTETIIGHESEEADGRSLSNRAGCALEPCPSNRFKQEALTAACPSTQPTKRASRPSSPARMAYQGTPCSRSWPKRRNDGPRSTVYQRRMAEECAGHCAGFLEEARGDCGSVEGERGQGVGAFFVFYVQVLRMMEYGD